MSDEQDKLIQAARTVIANTANSDGRLKYIGDAESQEQLAKVVTESVLSMLEDARRHGTLAGVGIAVAVDNTNTASPDNAPKCSCGFINFGGYVGTQAAAVSMLRHGTMDGLVRTIEQQAASIPSPSHVAREDLN